MTGLDTCGNILDGLGKIGVGPVTCEKACHYFEKGPPPQDMRLACPSKSGAQPKIAATIYHVSERATSEQEQARTSARGWFFNFLLFSWSQPIILVGVARLVVRRFGLEREELEDGDCVLVSTWDTSMWFHMWFQNTVFGGYGTSHPI